MGQLTLMIEPISDPADPRLAAYRQLRDPEVADRQGLFVAEGRFVVGRLLDSARLRTRSLLLTPTALAALGDLHGRVDAQVPVYVASGAVLRQVVGFNFHRGCVALAHRGSALAADDLLMPSAARALVALEAVADAENVGGVFRNAMAFGVDGVLLSPTTLDPLYRKAIRVSAGAALVVPFARADDWHAALASARAAGYTLVALTPGGDVDIGQATNASPVRERFVLLAGSEGSGLTPETLAAADLRVRIPIARGLDSLNLATATGIALHRLLGDRCRGPLPRHSGRT